MRRFGFHQKNLSLFAPERLMIERSTWFFICGMLLTVYSVKRKRGQECIQEFSDSCDLHTRKSIGPFFKRVHSFCNRKFRISLYIGIKATSITSVSQEKVILVIHFKKIRKIRMFVLFFFTKIVIFTILICPTRYVIQIFLSI